MGQPIDGVRFSAFANFVSARRDTVVVRLSARNAGRETRTLVWPAATSGCPPVRLATCPPGSDALVVRVAPLGGGLKHRVVWDSGKRAPLAAEARARLETTDKTQPDVTADDARVVRRKLAPGDSAEVASFVIPVRTILGDSLRGGFFRLTVRGLGNVWEAGELRAADLELRVPRR